MAEPLSFSSSASAFRYLLDLQNSPTGVTIADIQSVVSALETSGGAGKATIVYSGSISGVLLAR